MVVDPNGIVPLTLNRIMTACHLYCLLIHACHSGGHICILYFNLVCMVCAITANDIAR